MATNKGLRILFADDEPSLREFMRTELPSLGHEVTICADGMAAIKALEKEARQQSQHNALRLRRTEVEACVRIRREPHHHHEKSGRQS